MFKLSLCLRGPFCFYKQPSRSNLLSMECVIQTFILQRRKPRFRHKEKDLPRGTQLVRSQFFVYQGCLPTTPHFLLGGHLILLCT